MFKSVGSVAALAAPPVKGVYPAGTLAFGAVDHLVPGANNALMMLCNLGRQKQCRSEDQLDDAGG